MNPLALALSGISKSFGSLRALDDVTFTVTRGEIHALVGENGAGKSTLMQVAFGLLTPDAGTIAVDGRGVRVGHPGHSKRAGLGMVHQHFTSIGPFSIEENLWLAGGSVGHRSGQPPATRDTAVDRLRAALWSGLEARTRVETLPASAKQRLELLLALATGAETLLLDEPTALLAPTEVDALLTLLRAFAAGGGAVVLISHKLADVFSVADRITVLRRGQVVLEGETADLTATGVAAAMVGGAEEPLSASAAAPGEIRIVAGPLMVRTGEVVGIAAVEGNGQRQLLRMLAGLEPLPAGWQSQAPTAFLPGDRTTEGLIGAFSLTENLVLGHDSDPRWARGPWIDWGAAERSMGELIDRFAIRATGPSALARSLSGGNQQKLLFAKVAASSPAVVIAENPTRGLDFKATVEVHQELRRLATAGVAVLFHSADLDEVLSHSDRVVVLRGGQVLLVPDRASRAEVGALMVGG